MLIFNVEVVPKTVLPANVEVPDIDKDGNTGNEADPVTARETVVVVPELVIEEDVIVVAVTVVEVIDPVTTESVLNGSVAQAIEGMSKKRMNKSFFISLSPNIQLRLTHRLMN